MDTPAPHVVKDKQVEQAPRLLSAVECQAASRGVTSPAVGLDRDGLDIEEEQDSRAGELAPDPADSGQDRGPLRVSAAEGALHTTEVKPPFFRTRRRCSRLMALRIRCRMR